MEARKLAGPLTFCERARDFSERRRYVSDCCVYLRSSTLPSKPFLPGKAGWEAGSRGGPGGATAKEGLCLARKKVKARVRGAGGEGAGEFPRGEGGLVCTPLGRANREQNPSLLPPLSSFLQRAPNADLCPRDRGAPE
eukprot:scaffold75657_cov30-Tisochrysis_lutea.AAC.2